MNVASFPMCRAALAAAMCLLTQCSMPPREAWRIVQNDGLVPYLMGSYQPVGQTNRYLAMASSTEQNTLAFPRVPYRPPSHQSRYLTDNDSSDVPQADAPPYRPRTDRAAADVVKPETESSTAATDPAPDSKRLDKLLTPKDKPADSPSKLALDELPYGSPVSGRPGMVNSPFATKDQLVDVTGMSVGETVKCPYSGKLFRVPPTQQAASKSKATAPAPEPPEAPEKPAAEPKSSATPKAPVEPAKPAPDAAKPPTDAGTLKP